MRGPLRKGVVLVCGDCEEFFSNKPTLNHHQNYDTCKKTKSFSLRHRALERRVFGGSLKVPKITVERLEDVEAGLTQNGKGNGTYKQIHKKPYKNHDQREQSNITSLAQTKPRNKIFELRSTFKRFTGRIIRKPKNISAINNERPNLVSQSNLICKKDVPTPERRTRLFGCRKCNYITIFEGNLKKHHQKNHIANKILAGKNRLPPAVIDSTCKEEVKSEKKVTDNDKEDTISSSKFPEPFNCSLCPFKTFSSINFQQHMQLSHPEDLKLTYNCDFCDFKATSTYKIAIHTQEFHKQPALIYPCRTCTEKFSSYQLLLEHGRQTCNPCRIANGNEEVTEDVIPCPPESTAVVTENPFQTTPSKPNLESQTHSQNSVLVHEIFSCTFCEFQFIHRSFLNKHINFIHKSESEGESETQRYQCDLCLVICDSKVALVRHMDRHE